MSSYVATDAQEAPFNFDCDLDLGTNFNFDFNDWIDPMLPDVRPFEGGQSSKQYMQPARHFEPHSGSADAEQSSATFGGHSTSALLDHTCSATVNATNSTDNRNSDNGNDMLDAWSALSATEIDDGATRSFQTIQPSTSYQFRCIVPGCSREGDFARKYELDRHVAQRHANNATHKKFTCGALGCYKKHKLPWVFPRLDKLADHIRSSHRHDTAFGDCPVDGCPFRSSPLDKLGVHVRRVHSNSKGEARAITNATFPQRRRCPLPGCKTKLYALKDFLTHIASHEARDIYSARLNPCFESIAFDFVSKSPSHDDANAVVFINVACPVCNVRSPGFEQFRKRFLSEHLYLEPHGHEHFLSWLKALEKVKGSISGLLPWDNLRDTLKQNVKCPMCWYSVSERRYPTSGNTNYEDKGMSDGLQHPFLLRSTEQVAQELGPVRMQILRLFPEFGSHPIFDDCS